MSDWRGKPCPKCGRKGLHIPDHPHAFGHKDHGMVRCRFCKARFRERERERGWRKNP